MRRGTRAAIAVVVVSILVVAALWWGGNRRRSSASPPQAAPSAHTTAATGVPDAVATPRILPRWLESSRTRRVAGRVTADGAPLAGATVRLSRTLHAFSREEPAVRVMGQDGRFDFGSIVADEYRVGASAPGRTPLVTVVKLRDATARPGPDQLELELPACTAVLAGTVRDGSGGAIAGAMVRPGQSAAAIGAMSDERGAYELCLSEGLVLLDFAAEGYGELTVPVDIRGRTRRDVVLVPAASAIGTCVTAGDDAPVAGALVSAWAEVPASTAERAASHFGVTDEAGRFAFDELQPGRYHVRCQSEHAVTVPPSLQSAEVGAQPARWQVAMQPSSTVTGRVTAEGEPVARARVTLKLVGNGEGFGATRTNDDGSFELRHVPRGESVFVVENHEVRTPRSVRIDRQVHRDLLVEVARMGAIRGRVTRDGRAVVSADVTCRGPVVRAVSSGPEGAYACEGLSGGAFSVEASHRGSRSKSALVTVTLRDGDATEIDLELTRAASIGGVLVDPAGAPVSGARVRFVDGDAEDWAESISDERGGFVAGPLAGERNYTSRVLRPGDGWSELRQVPGPTTIAVPAATSIIRDVRIVVAANDRELHGRVIDAAGGAVADVALVAQARDALASTDLTRRAVSDLDGKFVFAGLPPGEYLILARASSGAQGIIPRARAGAQDVVVTLQPAAGIDGVLVGFDREPAVYAQLVGGDGELTRAAVARDRFRLDGLGPGTYVVSAMSGGEGAAAEVMLASGRRASVTLESRGTASIEGRVIDWATGEPVRDRVCRAALRAGELWAIDGTSIPAPQATTTPDGRFRFEAVPAGEIVVVCPRLDPATSSAMRSLSLARGAHVVVDAPVVRQPAQRSATEWASFGATFDPRRLRPRVQLVQAGGPGERAGLVPGDLVVEVDGRSVEDLSVDGVLQLVSARDPGSAVQVTVQRGARRFGATVVLAPWPGPAN